MASSSNSNWMPVQGRHQVNIGTSLGRALKARRLNGNPPPTTKRAIIGRDFYSFRYNNKPPTIDANKPGSIHARTDSAGTVVSVEHPTTKPGEVHLYSGREQSAKEVDCVLIYDEETGTFTLEKLDSYVTLRHERKTAQSTTVAAASPPAPSPAPSLPTARRKAEYDDIDRDLLELAEDDAEGEIDEEMIPVATSSRQQDEDEDEGEIFEPVVPEPPKRKPSPPPPPPPKAVPKPARATKPLPKSRVPPKQEPAAPPPAPAVVAPPPAPAPAPAPVTAPAKSKPTPKRKQTKKDPEPVPAVTHPDEEELTFGGASAVPAPSRTSRVAARSPSPAAPSFGGGLALPGGPSSFAPLPPAKPPSRTAIDITEDSDEEEEWDEVVAENDEVDEAEELAASINMDLLEEVDDGGMKADNYAEDAEERGDDEESDFLEDMFQEEVTEPYNADVQPISLNQHAGGSAFSDDDYTSSEESDDDE